MKFRDRTLLLLRARWPLITVLTLVSHLSLFLVLLLSLRFVGVSEPEVSWLEALAVFAFARLLTAIPLTPGGLGVVEVALITGLAAAGGARAQVAAGVLIFRALTYVLPIPIGLPPTSSGDETAPGVSHPTAHPARAWSRKRHDRLSRAGCLPPTAFRPRLARPRGAARRRRGVRRCCPR